MTESIVAPHFLELFATCIDEFCKTNGIPTALYYRAEEGLNGLFRLEMDRKSSTRKRERIQQALRHPQLTHQRRQAGSDFERTTWLGNPRTPEAAIALYRAAIERNLPEAHRELAWYQAMLHLGYPIDGPRPLWTFDVHQLIVDTVSDIPARFDLDPAAVMDTIDDCGDYAIACHQRLLAGRIDLPFGVFIQDKLNNHLIVPQVITSNAVGKTLGEIFSITPANGSAGLKILAQANVPSGTRLRIEHQWVAAAKLPQGAFDWREPFQTPKHWQL